MTKYCQRHFINFRYLYLLYFIILSNLPANGQNSAIGDIRKVYNQIVADIANGYLSDHQVNLHSVIPGMGSKNTTIHYYYTYQEDTYNPVLAMIIVEYYSAASAGHHLEFLYNASGELIFYFDQADGYDCRELRFYFNNNKLVKYQKNPLADMDNCIDIEFDEEEVNPGEEKVSNFSKEDLYNANQVLAKAAEYKKIFTGLVKIDDYTKPVYRFPDPEKE